MSVKRGLRREKGLQGHAAIRMHPFRKAQQRRISAAEFENSWSIFSFLGFISWKPRTTPSVMRRRSAENFTRVLTGNNMNRRKVKKFHKSDADMRGISREESLHFRTTGSVVTNQRKLPERRDRGY
jgi:hypothetical protein